MNEYNTTINTLLDYKKFSRKKFLETGGLVLTTALLAQCGFSRQAKGPDYSLLTAAHLVKGRTPRQDGFSMPAEWTLHERTIMAVPPAQNWAGFNMNAVRKVWIDTANAVAQFEPVTLVVDPGDIAGVRSQLNSSIEIIPLALNDGWTRDTGPIMLKNSRGERAVAGFTFNGWGEKLTPYNNDSLLKGHMAAKLNAPLYPNYAIVEGGAVTVDGQGTCITTEENLLHSRRNPNVDKAGMENILRENLGVNRIIWLKNGLVPDEITDGHVDGICVFGKPGQVFLHTTTDRSDPNFKICNDARSRLQNARDAGGRTLEIIEIPLANEVVHINFYICNGGVVVPIAGSNSEDDAPLQIIRNVFSDRKIVTVPGSILSKGGGGGPLHHATGSGLILLQQRRDLEFYGRLLW